MLSWTRVWTPTFLTETRLAFSRLVTARTQANADQDLFNKFRHWRPESHDIVYEQRRSAADLTGRLLRCRRRQLAATTEYNNVWDFIQNVSINKGKHAVKFGYEYRPIKFPFLPGAFGSRPVPLPA